jgi:hypothetical protein
MHPYVISQFISEQLINGLLIFYISLVLNLYYFCIRKN